MYKYVIIFLFVCGIAEAQQIQVTNKAQHPYRHVPYDFNCIDTPADGECLAFDSATARCEWVSCSGGGANSFLLMVDAASYVLQTDGSSKIILN